MGVWGAVAVVVHLSQRYVSHHPSHHPTLPPPQLRHAPHRRPPPARLSTRRLEYYSLSPLVKASILATLCDDLLDTGTIRNEVARREGEGEWHTGRGGEGGAYAMFLAEEKAVRRAAIDRADEAEGAVPEDGNVEACVLCGLGGSLLVSGG